MKRSHAFTASVVCTCVLMFVSSPNAQDNLSPTRIGVPQDWSQNHILFTRDGLIKNPGMVYSEPRVVFQAFQRQTASRPQEAAQASSTLGDPPHRDWSVSLNNGRVGNNVFSAVFPAKYSFDVAAPPSCAKDYVVFGLSRVGTNKQANLVAFNNLYSGTNPPGLCGAAPATLFAYNISTVTAGRILTSPVLSLDGTQIAFVESGNVGGVLTSVFHVLTWSSGPGNGTAANQPAVPGVGNTATMTSLPFAAALDTRSSPWIDYRTHTAYVGADDGNIYKIVNVFNGTPALAGAPWPVTISPGDFSTGPVLDNQLGQLLVGSQNGTLYKIDVSTGAIKSLVIGKGGTILAPPLVDVVNHTAFVVSANDGTSGILVQLNTNSMSQITKGRIGLASRSGTAVSLYQPAVSNTYFTNPASAVIRTCGTGANDITPWQYAFGFTGTTMNSTPVSSSQLLTSTNARCTGFTEFFNPNIGASGTDFFFFGLTQDCTAAGAAGGCVVARNANGSLTRATVAGGPSGIVVDNYSTAAQASSIYFGGLGTNTAIKLTQNGLQ